MNKRIAVCGPPRSGKTTFAKEIYEGRCPVYCTDDLIHLPWSKMSATVAKEWFSKPAPWVVEGCATARALRKWMRMNPDGKPCDEVIILERSYVALNKQQQIMAKGIHTILDEIAIPLTRRGVTISYR